MPPRPFPFPLRVGTDICSITRIQKIIGISTESQSFKLGRFLPKLLTWPERQYFWSRFQGLEHSTYSSVAVSQFLAGRWAAKEACRKACEHLGTSNGLHSIMILPITWSDDQTDSASSRPQGLILRDRLPEQYINEPRTSRDTSHAARFNIDSVEGQFCEVSISHDTQWATAVAIVPVLD